MWCGLETYEGLMAALVLTECLAQQDMQPTAARQPECKAWLTGWSATSSKGQV